MANVIITIQIIGAMYKSITRNNLKFEGKKTTLPKLETEIPSTHRKRSTHSHLRWTRLQLANINQSISRVKIPSSHIDLALFFAHDGSKHVCGIALLVLTIFFFLRWVILVIVVMSCDIVVFLKVWGVLFIVFRSIFDMNLWPKWFADFTGFCFLFLRRQLWCMRD